MEKLCDKDPKNRPSTEEILENSFLNDQYTFAEFQKKNPNISAWKIKATKGNDIK